MPRLITDEAALSAIETEYNRRKAWQTGGLQLAWIEKALHDAKDATLLGYDLHELMQTALLLRKSGITPEELREMCCCIDAAFDFISGLLRMEQQEMVNDALSHWMNPEVDYGKTD